MFMKYKNAYTYLAFLFCWISVIPMVSQNAGINYQAILRDDDGQILSNQNVALGFEIIRNQVNGPVVFTENMAVTTDDFGLVNLVIGQQNQVQFNQIDWGADNYFLKVSLNGNQIGNVRQFQAVPYSKIATDMELGNLDDVEIVSVAEGNVLVFQGGTWRPGTVETVTYTAGGGIAINDNKITNTAPDQIVTLTEGNNIDITGTYPNFTIAATTGGGGNTVWRTNGNNIYYDQGSISMGKSTAINGLNLNGFDYLPTGNLLDVNLPVNVRGNLFVRHDFGSINFGLSIQNSEDLSNVWTLHSSSSPSSPGFDKNLFFVRDNNIVSMIRTNGEFIQLSDARFKSDIRPLHDVLPKLTQLQARAYTTDPARKASVGFLAQEVKNIFPEAVYYDQARDVYMINYSTFGVLAVQAIKELKGIIVEQKHQLEQLMNRIEMIEKKLDN